MGAILGGGGALPVEFDAGANLYVRSKVSVLFGALRGDVSTALLGGNATFTGTSLAPLVSAAGAGVVASNTYAFMVIKNLYAAVFADVIGTIKYMVDPDSFATTYRQVGTTAVAAATGIVDSKTVAGGGGCRVDYTNGAGAQATFQFGSMGSGN